MSGPFEYNDDTVTAKMSVEIPQQSIENVTQLTQKFHLLRTEIELATRSEQGFLSYLDQMSEISDRATQSQRNFITQLERSSLVQRDIGGTTGGTRNLVPHGYNDPFGGMTQGLGNRVPSRSDLENTIAHLDPRTILNMQAQRGNVSPDDLTRMISGGDSSSPTLLNHLLTSAAIAAQTGGADDPTVRREKANKDQQNKTDPQSDQTPPSDEEQLDEKYNWGALGGQVLNEVKAGRFGGAMRAGASGIAAARGMGGGFGTLAKAGAAGALAVGAGLAINSGIQNAGEAYQGYKNQGLVRGGGFLEGVGQEFQARIMAISPFINTEQSRKIIQTALSQGYTGKEFETVTDLVAYNIKEMAMDINTSFAVIKKNMREGGQTEEGFRAQQEIMKQMSKDGAMSLPELQKQVFEHQGALIDQGVDAGRAGQIATQMSMSFPDDAAMNEVIEEVSKASTNNDQLLAQIGHDAGIKFRFPNEIPDKLSERDGPDGYNRAVFNTLRKFAVRSGWDPGQFMSVMQGFGINLTRGQSIRLLNHLKNGNPADVGQKKVEEQTKKTDGGPPLLNKVGSFFKALGKSTVHTFTPGKRDYGIIPQKWSEDWNEFAWETGDHHNPILDALEDTFRDQGGIEILDENGKPSELYHGSPTKEQLEGLTEGRYRWRKKGDTNNKGYTLEQGLNMTSENYEKYGKSPEQKVGGQLEIRMQPGMEKFFQTPNQVQLSPNQQQANAGWGDATDNNPPPGDRPQRSYAGGGGTF